MKQTIKTEQDTIQEEASESSVDVQSSADIEDASSLIDTVEDTASSFDMVGFECAECGVYHNHSDVKHQAGDSFDSVDAESAATEFDMNSSCHCGYNEAAMKGIGDAPSPSEAFQKAPIPDDVHRSMKQDYL